jgi:gluconokinase
VRRSCSALKEVYRERLSQRISRAKVSIVHLEGSFELIEARMKARDHQYMPATLLKSQFETLQKPPNAISVAIDISLQNQIEKIDQALA